MSRSTTDLKEIVRLGGGLSLDANTKSTADLKLLAIQTKVSGATLIVRNAGIKSTNDLKDIARLAPGRVIFEI
ncbi:MAG: hypothetical protein JWM14_2319 [Chitinophagaceae bacterium]|nr:hypothetical protein [Chitinophagaceae bacterium]